MTWISRIGYGFLVKYRCSFRLYCDSLVIHFGVPLFVSHSSDSSGFKFLIATRLCLIQFLGLFSLSGRKYIGNKEALLSLVEVTMLGDNT